MSEIWTKFAPAFYAGLFTTLKLCGTAWGIGCVLGILLGILAAHWVRTIGYLVQALAFLHAGFPAMVTMLWAYYPGQKALGIRVDGFWVALVVLSSVVVFSIAELVRRALRDFPQELLLAGKVNGLTRQQILRHIQAPLLVRELLPPTLAVLLLALHGSLFASLISVPEIFRKAQEVNAVVYQPVAVYTILALIFLAICLPLHGVTEVLRRKLIRTHT